MVHNLLASTVNDMRDLVRNDKLYVLRCKFIPNKQAIFYLNSTDHVWIQLVHLLIVLPTTLIAWSLLSWSRLLGCLACHRGLLIGSVLLGVSQRLGFAISTHI